METDEFSEPIAPASNLSNLAAASYNSLSDPIPNPGFPLSTNNSPLLTKGQIPSSRNQISSGSNQIQLNQALISPNQGSSGTNPLPSNGIQNSSLVQPLVFPRMPPPPPFLNFQPMMGGILQSLPDETLTQNKSSDSEKSVKFGWASGTQKIGDRYSFLKTDEYLENIRKAEKRIMVQLAYLHLIDTKKTVAEFVKSLSESEIILITHMEDVTESVVRLFLKVNVIKHTTCTISSLVDMNLVPKKQVIILGDSPTTECEYTESIEKIKHFVSLGGMFLSFNTGIALLDKIFPGKFKYRRGQTTVEKPIYINVSLEGSEEEIFGRYLAEYKKRNQLVLRQGVQRFSVVDPQVRVLLTEVSPTPKQPLVTKFHYGDGTVYHLLTSHLASKVGDQGGASFQGLSEMLDLPSKELAIETIKSLEKMDPQPLITISAWKNAFNCGYPSSINAARALELPLYSFFVILIKALRS